MRRVYAKAVSLLLSVLLLAVGFAAYLPREAFGYEYLHSDTTSIYNRAWISASPSGYLELIGSDPNGPRPGMPNWELPGGTNAYVVAYQFAIWGDAGGQDDLVWYTAGNGSWSRGGANMGTGDLTGSKNGTGFGCIATYGYGWGGTVLSSHGGLDELMHNHIYIHSTIAGVGDTEGTGLRNYGSVDFWPRVSIRYDANGGSGAPGSQYKYIGSVGAVSSKLPVRVGYTFEGWSTERQGPVNVRPGQKIGYQDWNLQVESLVPHGWNNGPSDFWRDPSAGRPSPSGSNTITLYAQWKPVSYVVSYEGNGATGGSTSDSVHVYDAPKALTMNGYERSYRLTCDAQGGSMGVASLACVWPWASWNARPDGSGESCGDGSLVKNMRSTKGKATLYAQWHPGTVVLPDPGEKPGHVFEGWYSAASGGDFVGSAGASISIAADTTCYARWQALAEVTYYADGQVLSGFGDLLPAGVAYRTSAEAAAAAVKQDCAGFEGWFVDASCTKRYAEGSPLPSEGLRLYGRNKVSVSYAQTDRSTALFADRTLYADQDAGSLLDRDALLPPGETLFYGDRITFDRGPSVWFEDRDRLREASCEPGAYATAAAEGLPARTVVLTCNTVAYLNWRIPLYDGVAVS